MRPTVFDLVTVSRRRVTQLLGVALFIACVTVVDFSRLRRHPMTRVIKFDPGSFDPSSSEIEKNVSDFQAENDPGNQKMSFMDSV